MSFSFSADKTLGAGFIGFSVSCVVFGVHSLQAFSYWVRYPLDRGVYKGLVTGLWLLEAIHQCFVGHAIYHYTISNYMSPTSLLSEDVAWTLVAQILLGALIGTIVKACFAMRVWRFSNRNLWVTSGLMAIVFGQLGASIAFSVRCFQLKKLLLFDDLKVIASCALSLGAFADIATAAALSWYLKNLRTGYSASDTLVTTLTIYAINTGAVTSAFGIVVMILYNIYAVHNFLFMAFYFVMIKLYGVSFMCTLNTRRVRRGRGTDKERTTSQTGYSGSFYMVHHRPSLRAQHPSQTKSLAIGIHQEVSVMSDVQELPDSPVKHPQAAAMAF